MKKGALIANSILCGFLTSLYVLTTVLVNGPFNKILTQVFGGYGVSLSGEEAEVLQKDVIEFTKDITKEGIVLLRNERNALPLKEENKINVFGWSSISHIVGGSGGSGGASTIEVSISDSLKNANYQVNEEISEMYKTYQADRTTESDFGYTTSWSIPEPSINDKNFYTDELLDRAKQFSDSALLIISRGSGEGVDIPEGYLSLTNDEKDLAKYLVDNYKNVIVVINSNSVMEIGYLQEIDVEGIFFMPGTGAYGAESLGKLIRGTVNPSGHTSDTFAYDHKSSPAYYFANRQGTKEYSDLKNWYYVDYVEGIYVGYKYYETAYYEKQIDYDNTVMYPFGYGLSYSTFKQEVIDVRGDLSSPVIEIDVKVTNTSDVSGKEVVQIYATPEYYKNGIEKAYVDLVGFEKTKELAPAGQLGDSEIVTVTVNPFEIASYDYNDKNNDGHKGYILEHGNYELKLMKNSHEMIGLAADFNLTEDILIDEDPVTKTKINNLFDDAAGEEETETVKYLSRANFKDTFPVQKYVDSETGRKASAAILEKASKKDLIIPENDSVKPVTTNKENNLRLYTLEDGTFANKTQLSGDLKSGEKLVLNTELVDELLSDYDSPLWESLLDQMSLKEMEDLITNCPYGTDAAESIGLMATKHTDGPQGVSSFSVSGGKGINYPVQEYVAMTFNKEIATKQGEMFGKEAKLGKIAGLYAPASNIHRTPYSGRNFEYYSEDGFISGSMASKVVLEAQKYGTFMYMKHFALNDQEQRRGEHETSLVTWANEQAMREIFLKPFEIAVKEGNLLGMMTSFNRIGSTWTGNSKALLTDLLRNEWGFKGQTITDLHLNFGFEFGELLGDQWWMNANRGVVSGQDSWLMLNLGLIENLDENNTVIQHAMRDCVKHMVYTVCHTTTTPSVIKSNWFIVAVSIEIVVGLLLAGYIYLIIRGIINYNRKKNQ